MGTADLQRTTRRGSVGWYRRIAIQPWFASASAIVGTIAGVLAALWTDHIKTAFPFQCCGGAVDTHALAFWTALVAFGVMFGSNAWAQSSVLDWHTSQLSDSLETVQGHTTRLSEGLETLRDSSRTLQEQLQTLPPRYFLEAFDALLRECYPVAVKALQPTATPKDMREGVISVLSSLLYMAKLFDAEPRGTDYTANIMVFRSFEGLSHEQIAAYEARAKFSFRTGGWSGVLEPIPSLAISLSGDDIRLERDERAPRVVLDVPLPRWRVDYGKSTVLPGAPEAFCEGAYTFVHDTQELANECRRERALSETVLVEMDRYFREEGQHLRSFVSMPLQRVHVGDPALAAQPPGEYIGVVNIHCDVKNILRARGVGLFVPITAAHRLLIARLVDNILRHHPAMVV